MRRTLSAAAMILMVSFLALPAVPHGQGHGDAMYASIDGKHLKGYVDELTAMSRRYRDNGHPQFWGRIIGTDADAENARWLLGKFKAIGLSDVHEQPFDLPPQWMPQSWNVSMTASGAKTLALSSAQPTYRGVATPADGLDLEAADVGFATDADLAGRDLRGKAVFFYSMDYQSRHSTISHGAVKRIGDKGAAAIFITLLIPGNMHFQFYPVASEVPTFALGYEDGMSAREAIGQARAAGTTARVRLKLDVAMTPNLKTATIWGTLPGATDETVVIVAHRDGWFEAANDNGTGVATMAGLAEYFAKIPQAQRRRTIVFLGTTGHHDGTAESGTWLSQHKEVFAKTALLINCEHTAANQLIASNNAVVRKANVESPLSWYVGGSPTLEQIAARAYQTFDVKLLDGRAAAAAGEIGRIQNLAPSLQLIDTGLYWHSDKETSDIVPENGLAAVTRAYAKIIADTGGVAIKDLMKN
ncbi:MAG: M28 family peptidase [Acidobacteriia bacterium]|nr:M28 family peptidase [Terriglobia bacterium]